jgi:hypothetical protein
MSEQSVEVDLGVFTEDGGSRRRRRPDATKKQTHSTHAKNADQIRWRVNAEIDAIARKEGFADFEEKVLSIPSFSAHPSWVQGSHDDLIGDDGSLIRLGVMTMGWFPAPGNLRASRINGVTFITEDPKPLTIKQTVDWLRKTHPDVVASILQKYGR